MTEPRFNSTSAPSGHSAVPARFNSTSAPFDRWRASYRHRPGQLPTREKLDSLAPETLVTVRADVLLQLVVQAENHEADSRHLCGAQEHEPCLSGSRTRGSGVAGVLGTDAASLSAGLETS